MQLEPRHTRITNRQLQWLSWAMVCVICVGVTYFVPSHRGPFSTVRGPVTAFQSLRRATATKSSISVEAARPSRSPAPVLPAKRARIRGFSIPAAAARELLELNCALLV